MLRPLKDWIFIKPEPEPEGLIKLPTEKRPEKGRIVAVGGGRFNKHGNRHPMTLRVGDMVYLGRAVDGIDRLGVGGYEFEHDRVRYFVIREREVLGIMQNIKK